MSEKLYCTYCGALNEEGALYCERCGHELEPLSVPAQKEAPEAEPEDLLTVLMEEPVTKIPDEPAAPERRAADAGSSRPDADVLNDHTQLFSRTELNAAIAASEAEKTAAAARKEQELQRQKERLIEESIRYYEDEKRDREEQRVARSRRQQEDALYAEFEKPAAGGYGAQGGGYAAAGYEAPPKKKKTWIPILIVLLLLLAAGGFFGWKYFFNKTTVDLTRNISTQDIYLEGKDGEATVILDDETLHERADYPRGNEKAEQFMETVSYTAEPSTGLSNGDTIVIRAIYSEETAKSLHITVKGEEKKFEVSGLDEKSSVNWDPLNLFGDDDKDTDKKEDAKDTLIPEIDTRYYTEADVQGKSKDEVQAMLNELYARHGYIFKDETLKSQYEKTDWYKGTETDMSKVEQSFNTYEKKNLEYLTDVRSKM